MEQFLTIPNGKKVTPTFTSSEAARRLKLLRDHMASENLEAVLFSSIHNINYFSDFLYCAFGRNYGLVVTQEKAVTISANIDGGQPYRRSNGENLVYTDWQKDNFFRAVRSEIANRKRIGVEFDHLTLQNHQKLIDALPEAEFSDIGASTMRMRMIKSDEEIDLIRHGAQIGDIGGAHCVEAIGENVPEYEVALHATRAMVREIAKRFPHGELMDSWTWFQSGLNTDGAHNPVTSRHIQKGDILSLNCFPMIAGYYTALERTLFLDHASDRHLELWEVNCKVHRRGLELIRPGARCCDIALELNEIYKEHDLLDRRTFGYGHSFGTLSHYYGREAGLELREDIETVLEPNMVVSMEPMIMLPEGMAGAGGYREHDILVIHETGAENITEFPFGPEHNIVPA
ncbi:M24 family metallopeptidase [Denitrobaculum tricleocarpae]|uniref:M24 family metallopeptidase n=1 Tax=Denitrobaculum tricleocarpae TaxID=2591009 RepID=A0A545TXL4_9PROT|nr:M24 family metallopeptidase [Denitrobaculum tricleocarpae]TQV81924.1 M24 family metallopeptidase [Denitrobaculum tricleocarpae]